MSNKPLTANAITVINAVRTSRTLDDTAQITGLSKAAIIGTVVALGKRGLASMAEGTITLTDAGKEHVNRKRGMNQNKNVFKAHEFLSQPEMMELVKKSEEGDRSARKQRVVALAEHLGMSFAGANTYVGNFDQKRREATTEAKA
jgi:hypothetical protein